jgi:hypothetical protein
MNKYKGIILNCVYLGKEKNNNKTEKRVEEKKRQENIRDHSSQTTFC